MPVMWPNDDSIWHLLPVHVHVHACLNTQYSTSWICTMSLRLRWLCLRLCHAQNVCECVQLSGSTYIHWIYGMKCVVIFHTHKLGQQEWQGLSGCTVIVHYFMYIFALVWMCVFVCVCVLCMVRKWTVWHHLDEFSEGLLSQLFSHGKFEAPWTEDTHCHILSPVWQTQRPGGVAQWVWLV